MTRIPDAARRAGWGMTLGLSAVLTGCALPAGAPGGAGPDLLPPPGYGTLRQEEVTVSLVSGELQIKVTPLAEEVTRVTAPDTYRRLSGLAARYRTDEPEGSLFLVSIFSESPNAFFVSEDLNILSRGARLRPTAIHPITPGWGQGRIAQRETETAVYAFGPGVDVESDDLIVAYGLVENRTWTVVLPRIQAERARARARAQGEVR